MQKAISKHCAAAVLATAQCLQGGTSCPIEANVGFTTDYIWRGMTQNEWRYQLLGMVLIFPPTVVFTLAPG